MKIGIIAPFDALSIYSGASARVHNIAECLNACGASVYVLHHGPTLNISQNFRFINFKKLDVLTGSSNYLHPLNVTYYGALIRFFKKFQPDIIQCEQPWSLCSTIYLAHFFGIPCILDEHNVEFKWGLSASRLPFLAPINLVLEKTACSHSSFILTTSDIDKKILMRTYKISNDKILVVPNGVNTQRFSVISCDKLSLKKKLNLSSQRKVVLFHGIMSAKQNYEAADLIIDFIAPKFPRALFIIIGQGCPNWIINKARSHENVRFLGFISNLDEYISASDLCILPIRCGSGTRLKLMDYLAAGKPIVSTVIGAEGIPITSGVQAILCDDVNSGFIEAMNNILEDLEATRILSAESKKLAEKMSWQNIARSLYCAYMMRFRKDPTTAH